MKKRISGHTSLKTVARNFILVNFPENIVFFPIVDWSCGRAEGERRGWIDQSMLCYFK